MIDDVDQHPDYYQMMLSLMTWCWWPKIQGGSPCNEAGGFYGISRCVLKIVEIIALDQQSCPPGLPA